MPGAKERISLEAARFPAVPEICARYNNFRSYHGNFRPAGIVLTRYLVGIYFRDGLSPGKYGFPGVYGRSQSSANAV